MNRAEAIHILRTHETELRSSGILHLSVFGSQARGDQSALSDVDLLADFDKSRQYTLVTMGRLEMRLSEILGAKVDLSSPEWLKDSVREQALREAVVAF